MAFSTVNFIFVFLPIVLFVYFAMARFVSHNVQRGFLIAASLFFCGYAKFWFVGILLGSVLVNYLSATCIAAVQTERRRKLALSVGILFNILLLGYYKYTNFLIENVNELFGTEYLLKVMAIPLGISFFTFQQMVFLFNVRKGESTVPGFFDYIQFVTFFPYLVSGPIVFTQDVLSQYQDEKNRYFNFENFNKGLFLFVLGLFKKVFIADSLSLFSANGFFNETAGLSFGGAWVTSLAYTLQILFDFSGYTDMALGVAKMLNINLPINFNSPYLSKSITEFWKRWHITLGRALAVIVYFPLGGNRKGLPRTCLNLFMVFLVSGIWHGASWNFIIWGCMHGVVRVFEKLFEKQLDKVPGFIRIFFTFMFVNAAWVFFMARSLDSALLILKKMFLPDRISFEGINKLATDGILSYTPTIQNIYILSFIAILLGIVFVYRKNSINLYRNFTPNKKNVFLMSVLFCLSVVQLSRAVVFIYFNF